MKRNTKRVKKMRRHFRQHGLRTMGAAGLASYIGGKQTGQLSRRSMKSHGKRRQHARD